MMPCQVDSKLLSGFQSSLDEGRLTQFHIDRRGELRTILHLFLRVLELLRESIDKTRLWNVVGSLGLGLFLPKNSLMRNLI